MARIIFDTDFKTGRRGENIDPFSCAMHEETVMGGYFGHHSERGHFRVELRRWIERNLEGDVIVKVFDKSYRVEQDRNSFQFRDIRHRYHVFHFETEADLMHFRLKWSEKITNIQEKHPKYD